MWLSELLSMPPRRPWPCGRCLVGFVAWLAFISCGRTPLDPDRKDATWHSERGLPDLPCTDCDDGDSCTTDFRSGVECSASCVHAPVTACINHDGCCPPTCAAGDDDDCKSGQVAAGAWHACAVTHGDLVACWGNNLSGELGNDVNAGVPAETDAGAALKPNPIPVLVAGASAVELTAGCHHTCARRRDGKVDCWGANYSGQLGNGTTESSSRPVNVPGLTAIQISAGCSHTCALTSAQDIVCWGDGSFAQLGTDTLTSSPVPVAVPGQKAVQIAAGTSHAAALRSDGTVISWGLDQSALFGIGEVHTVSDLIALEISAGQSFTCARTERSEVTCWGWNVYGQLGNGTTDNNNKPQNVISGLLAVQVAAGTHHACARSIDGHVVCWGSGYGPEPHVVPSIENALQISAGSGFTCARTKSALFCWGQNGSGQLGNGSTFDSPVPVAVALP